jgi:IclR family acetate operon transcriptional repressor
MPLKQNFPKINRRDTVKSIDNALRLLEYMSSKEVIKITQISKDLGIDIATIHRMLKTMIKRGYIEQDKDTRKYQLGLNARLLGISAMKKANLYKHGLQILEEISNITDETANLIVRNQWEAVYVLQAESRNTLRVANHVGSRVSLYCTAGGKVLLAYMDESIRQAYFEEIKLVSFTPNTLVSKAKLEEELKAIRKTQIAFDREEQAIGESCIATPVFGHNNKITAAISISFPTTRLVSTKSIEELSNPLRKASKALSQKLGTSIPFN